MAFAVFADGSANLPKSMLEGIQLLPCNYTVDGEPQTYWGDVDHFVRTTLLNTQLFLSRFAPFLTQGIDVIYIAMSSGISGTYNAARIAAEELMELYSGRFVHIVDSLGCGFGNGLLAVRAAELSRRGVPRDCWDEALGQRPDNTEKIDKLIAARLHDPDDRDEVRKVTAALFRRGFGWDEIRAALARFSAEVELEDN